MPSASTAYRTVRLAVSATVPRSATRDPKGSGRRSWTERTLLENRVGAAALCKAWALSTSTAPFPFPGSARRILKRRSSDVLDLDRPQKLDDLGLVMIRDVLGLHVAAEPLPEALRDVVDPAEPLLRC